MYTNTYINIYIYICILGLACGKRLSHQTRDSQPLARLLFFHGLAFVDPKTSTTAM